MKNAICLLLTLTIFLFCSVQENFAQAAEKKNQNSFELQTATAHQKKSNAQSKTVEAAPIQKPVFKNVSSSQEEKPLGVQAKSKLHPSQTIAYWNTYIENTEKQIVDLQRNAPPNTSLQQKLEAALERAKIRKALISNEQ